MHQSMHQSMVANTNASVRAAVHSLGLAKAPTFARCANYNVCSMRMSASVVEAGVGHFQTI